MLFRYFNLSELRDYEVCSGVSVLSFLSKPSFSVCLDLIAINKFCSLEEAGSFLDKQFSMDVSFQNIVLELSDVILIRASENTDESEILDISSISSITELYQKFCMELMSLGFSYSEFWSLNTKELYFVFNSISVKMQNDINRELINFHSLAAMVGSAVWGKLDSKPPRLNIDSNKVNSSDLDSDTQTLVAKLASLVTRKE